MRLFLLLIALLLSPAAQAQLAEDVTFQSPLRCTLGTDCWVMNYVDRTPEGDNKAVDNACAARTYDGHKGTDFAIPNEAAMTKGVDVLAARAGKILRVRDGEDDRFPTTEQLAKTRTDKKECGNAVLIDHGQGWQTLYCHLKKNSIAVKIGDSVKAGDKIASVGLSGETQFPHVHFGVIHNGKIIDPFSGTDAGDDCATQGTPLWDSATNFHYEDLSIFAAAFDKTPPTLDSLDKGRPPLTTLSAKEAPALLYYTLLGGVQKSDAVHLLITAPDGTIFAERTEVMEKNRARQLLYIGRKTDQIQLQQGSYKGSLEIRHKDKTWHKETILNTTP